MNKTAYSYEEAAAEVGYSERTMKEEAARNRLVVHYANSKPIILHTDLVACLESLPTERPK